MRLTVNLDDESHETLEELAQRENASKSQVVRDAIDHYDTVTSDWQAVDEDALDWYVRLLESGEHRIFDVDHIDAFLAEIGSPSESLLAEWERIGRKHGIEWAHQFDSVEKKLRVLEYCNWYSITSVADDQYALTTSSADEAALMRAFLVGECAELGLDIEARQVDQKILVTDNSA
jgi:predicted transcriptional regulator